MPGTIGEPFIILPAVDSTNNYAMGLVRQGTAIHGTAIFACSQYEGRGQRGKTWQSAPGENIILSTVIQPSTAIPHRFLFSAAIALACYDLIKNYALSEVSIKWPNDVYWGDRKAAGILIENSFRGTEWRWSVAGTGVNVNQDAFGTELPFAVSLRQITGARFDAVVLAKELCRHEDTRYRQLIGDPESILNDYNAALYKSGQAVLLKTGGRVIETVVRAVKYSGELTTSDVVERNFAEGEITWIR